MEILWNALLARVSTVLTSWLMLRARHMKQKGPAPSSTSWSVVVTKSLKMTMNSRNIWLYKIRLRQISVTVSGYTMKSLSKTIGICRLGYQDPMTYSTCVWLESWIGPPTIWPPSTRFATWDGTIVLSNKTDGNLYILMIGLLWSLCQKLAACLVECVTIIDSMSWPPTPPKLLIILRSLTVNPQVYIPGASMVRWWASRPCHLSQQIIHLFLSATMLLLRWWRKSKSSLVRMRTLKTMIMMRFKNQDLLF